MPTIGDFTSRRWLGAAAGAAAGGAAAGAAGPAAGAPGAAAAAGAPSTSGAEGGVFESRMRVPPRSISIENGVARVTYPQLDSGTDQLGAHMLELKLDGAWRRVLGSWYGDWTYFIGPLSAPATRAQVLTDTAEAVEVAFEFDHAIQYPVTAHDFRGRPIDRN